MHGVADPIAAGHADFLARLLTERARLAKLIELLDATIPIYERLLEGAPAPITPYQRGETDTPIAGRPRVPGEVSLPDDRLWHPARCEIIRRDYPAGVPTGVIQQRLNALPGRFVPRDRIAIQACRLGLSRPSGFSSAHAPAAPVPAAPAPTAWGVFAAPDVAPSIPAPAAADPAASLSISGAAVVPEPPTSAPKRVAAVDPGPPVAADFEQVRRWAGEGRGIVFASWDDLPLVNRCRERLGLAMFKRDFTRGRR